MIPPDSRNGDSCKIMDAVAIGTRSQRIEGTEYIEYNISRATKVKYTPPSPTTSGYSESGSEMDNHDSGRASELEGSPKVPLKRPDKISLGLELFDNIGSGASTTGEFAGFKGDGSVSHGERTTRVAELPRGVLTVEASTLHSLMYSLQNTRNRLDRMERNMDALIKAISLQNKVSNEAVVKLTRTLLALGNDVKNFRETRGSDEIATTRQTLTTNEFRYSELPQSSHPVSLSRNLSKKSDYESATYPRLLRSDPHTSTLSVAPPSGSNIESYDNVPSNGKENAEGSRPQSAGFDPDEVTSLKFAPSGTNVKLGAPLYSRVQKVKSADNLLSGSGFKEDRPPTLPRRSTDMLTSVKADEMLDVEKLLSDLELPTGSPKQGDDCSAAESLTRISRFSDVESLMSAFDNEENNLFSEDEFNTDESGDEDFDTFVTPMGLTAISPDQGISSAADLSQSGDTHCTENTRSSPALLDKDADEYSSSIIVPSRSMTSITESEKDRGRVTKPSPLHGKKAGALLANYKKIFKRKKKRAESQTSFTFVTSPLYEKGLQQNPPKPNKKLKQGYSVESVISSKKMNDSSLSLASSIRDESASLGSRPQFDLSPAMGSPRQLTTHQSRENTQLFRLQSREDVPDDDTPRDDKTLEHVLSVSANVESYDNFTIADVHDTNSADNHKIPNGNILVESVILEDLQREQADRIRFEQGEPPPKPSRPGQRKGSPRSSVNQHPNGGPGYRGPAVPPKQNVFTPEELANHEAQERLRQSQFDQSSFQQRLTQQQREAEENEKWLQQEERNLFTSLQNPDARTRGGSSGSMTELAPPPPNVVPAKPPRKLSKPKDDQPHGPPQTKLEEVKTAPTMQLNRDNDEVYKNTMEVVKAVLGMNSMTMEAKAEELFNSVKAVGGALKQLCACLDKVLPELPEDFHREIDMAQRTTNKDLSQVINQLKLVQRFYNTTQVVEYKKCLMAANQVLAIDAKNLLDVVDRARIRKIQTAQDKQKAQASDIRRGESRDVDQAVAHEPEDVYPDDDFL